MRLEVRRAVVLIALLGSCLHLLAHGADSVSLRPSFGLDYTGEVQTDFHGARVANLLQLHADIPLSRKFSFQAASISTLATSRLLDVLGLQGYSNIETYGLDIPFALSVAGFTWQLNDRHSLFAGIRNTDEDYFCSDGLALFTNSSCGIFPTLSYNYPICTYPFAAMGIHYAYDHERLRLQASLYNGMGDYHFSGRYNVFRVCPGSDGVFAIGQAEYRYRDSRYFLGACLHSEYEASPAAWAYAEQALLPGLTLIAAYSHAFGSDNLCENFYAVGGKYDLGRAELGLFTDYTRVAGVDEWATEFLCDLRLTDFLSVEPVLHVITTDGETNCIGMLRVNISI